jgi:hypothetical protein
VTDGLACGNLLVVPLIAVALLGLVGREPATHPRVRLTLGAVGYGFVMPAFLASRGRRFDLVALIEPRHTFFADRPMGTQH